MSEWEVPGKSDDWFTPEYVFDAMGVEFDADVAAAPWGRGYLHCGIKLNESGLTWNWHPNWFVWMNPPFGKRNGILPWLEKFAAHGNGVALMPDRTSAPWFQWISKRVDRILFVSPKIKFERPDGTIGVSPGSGTALMSIGTKGGAALINAHVAGLGILVRPER